MKYVFILSVLFVSSSLTQAVNAQESYTIKYRKVVDTQTGMLDNELCMRDCPKYPGGEEALFNYIYSQLGFSGETDNKSAITIVKFLITNSGKVRDVSIEKTANEEYDRDILKVISSLPNFRPSKDGTSCFYGWVYINCSNS